MSVKAILGGSTVRKKLLYKHDLLNLHINHKDKEYYFHAGSFNLCKPHIYFPNNKKEMCSIILGEVDFGHCVKSSLALFHTFMWWLNLEFLCSKIHRVCEVYLAIHEVPEGK